MKKCSICGLEKAEADYYSCRLAKDGLMAACKPCARARTRANRQKMRARETAGQRAQRLAKRRRKYAIESGRPESIMTRKCRSCGLEKPISEYWSTPKKKHLDCKICARKIQTQKRKERKESYEAHIKNQTEGGSEHGS